LFFIEPKITLLMQITTFQTKSKIFFDSFNLYIHNFQLKKAMNTNYQFNCHNYKHLNFKQLKHKQKK